MISLYMYICLTCIGENHRDLKLFASLKFDMDLFLTYFSGSRTKWGCSATSSNTFSKNLEWFKIQYFSLHIWYIKKQKHTSRKFFVCASFSDLKEKCSYFKIINPNLSAYFLLKDKRFHFQLFKSRVPQSIKECSCIPSLIKCIFMTRYHTNWYAFKLWISSFNRLNYR